MPGYGKSGRLLIIEFCAFTVTNRYTVCDAVSGKFNIFRSQEEVPSIIFLNEFTGNHIAGAGYHTAVADTHSAAV